MSASEVGARMCQRFRAYVCTTESADVSGRSKPRWCTTAHGCARSVQWYDGEHGVSEDVSHAVHVCVPAKSRAYGSCAQRSGAAEYEAMHEGARVACVKGRSNGTTVSHHETSHHAVGIIAEDRDRRRVAMSNRGA